MSGEAEAVALQALGASERGMWEGEDGGELVGVKDEAVVGGVEEEELGSEEVSSTGQGSRGGDRGCGVRSRGLAWKRSGGRRLWSGCGSSGRSRRGQGRRAEVSDGQAQLEMAVEGIKQRQFSGEDEGKAALAMGREGEGRQALVESGAGDLEAGEEGGDGDPRQRRRRQVGWRYFCRHICVIFSSLLRSLARNWNWSEESITEDVKEVKRNKAMCLDQVSPEQKAYFFCYTL